LPVLIVVNRDLKCLFMFILFHLDNFVQGLEFSTFLGCVCDSSNTKFNLLIKCSFNYSNLYLWGCFRYRVMKAFECNFLVFLVSFDIIMLHLSNYTFDFKEFLCWSKFICLSVSDSLQKTVWLQSFVELLYTGLRKIFDSEVSLEISNDVSLHSFWDCSSAFAVKTLSAFNNSIISINFSLISQKCFSNGLSHIIFNLFFLCFCLHFLFLSRSVSIC